MERTDYQDTFDPLKHLEVRCNPAELTGAGTSSKFVVTSLHNFFVSHSEQFKGTPLSVLDYGCGPLIANVISASQYASEIVLAEYTDSSCDCLQKWMDKSPNSFDWSHYFDYIVHQLEGKSKEEAAEREEKLRQLIKAIVPCDITSDPPISPQYSGPYDILVNILVIDATATTIDEYEQQVKSLATLIKPGGYLLLMVPCLISSEEQYQYSFYKLDQQKFTSTVVTKSYLQSLLERAGFEEIQMAEGKHFQSPLIKTYTFVNARKRSDVAIS